MNSRLLAGIGIFIFLMILLSANFAQVAPPSFPNPWAFLNGNIFNLNKGNVGIGTTAPTQKLEVVGGFKLNPSSTKPNCDSSTEGTEWFTKATNYSPSILELCVNQGEFVQVMNSKIPSPRYGLSCAYSPIKGKIYCFGGIDEQSNTTDQILEYDSINDQLQIKSSTLLVLSIYPYQVPCINSSLTGKIYCLGVNQTAIDEYDPSTDSVKTMNAIIQNARIEHTCTESSYNQHIYCFGGQTPTGVEKTIEYDPLNDLSYLKNSVVAQRGMNCVNSYLTNKIYCFGKSQYVEEYDPATDLFTQKQPSVGQFYFGACDEDQTTGKINCFGGTDSGAHGSDRIFTYDPSNDSLADARVTLPETNSGFSCAFSASNYCFGGIVGGPGKMYDTIVQYNESITNPLSFQWKKIA